LKKTGTTSAWNPDDPLRPELVIGLVGTVGTDLKRVSQLLQQSLRKQVAYKSHEIRLSSLLTEYDVWGKEGPPSAKSPEDDRIDKSMMAGTELRRAWVAGSKQRQGDALARLALGGIREKRGGPVALRETAFILRSLKHADEARFLQKLYGPGFILVGAFSSKEARKAFLRKAMESTRRGPNRLKGFELDDRINDLIQRDYNEEGVSLGQQVSKTYHLADFFVDLDKRDAQDQVDRFVRLLFGYPHHTPTRDEHAMFIAHAAATRSGSLARQVGAAITTKDGEVISVGCNEVAKVGGGQVWEEEPSPERIKSRDRDFDRGFDTSTRKIKELVEDAWKVIWKRLKKSLADQQEDLTLKELLRLESQGFPGDLLELFKGTKLRDLIEFYREVHAETGSLVSAARRGVSVQNAVLYSTTYPCHECAKHIVAAGVSRVVYVEPYPKSKAPDFYPTAFGDSESDMKPKAENERLAESFVGVGPKKYRDLFSLASGEGQGIERKASNGDAKTWDGRKAELRWHTWSVSYLDMEPVHIKSAKNGLDSLRRRAKK
jgi:deoxycytidylate deaminase